MDLASLLALYDRQLRKDIALNEPGVAVERGETFTRIVGDGPHSYENCVLYFRGGTDTDGLIAEQIAYFRDRGRAFEWKHHSHDLPADLPARLLVHGFIPEEPETFVVLDLDHGVGHRPDPAIRVEHVTDPNRIAYAIESVQAAVYPDSDTGLGNRIAEEFQADPAAMEVHVAYDGDTPVCTGWVRFHGGTAFASLWGGSTLPSHRRRGIYQSLVARRAAAARERGFRYLTVDASPNSLPILKRLGFVPACVTTPYVWQPPA